MMKECQFDKLIFAIGLRAGWIYMIDSHLPN